MKTGPKTQQPLSRERKMGFVFLLIFAILTIGLGGLQMRNTIYGPFIFRVTKADRVPEIVIDEETRLQKIDTDRDGLNDYEELFFYETSPYLEDTDSDGILDKEELDGGSDPLCPKGDVCERDVYETPDSEEPVSVQLGDEVITPGDMLGTLPDNAPSVGIPTGSQDVAQIQSMSALLQDAAVFRQSLLATGKVTKEQLDQLNDDQLMGMLNEFLTEQGQKDLLEGLQQ